MLSFLRLMPEEKLKYYAPPLSILFVFVLGYVDYVTGYELSFFVFYVFPVALGAWFVGVRFGLFLSVLAICVWFYADRLSGNTYSQDWIIYWNAGMRFMFFAVDTLLLATLKKKFDFEKDSARIDSLTGALNGRGFRDRLETMVPLATRTKAPFALVFIDLDNFKKVNDTKGHAMGDLILQRSIATMKKNLRETDFIGRIGGDEFAIFLPATDEKGATKTMQELREKMLAEVDAENWGIGYSMGMVTLDPHKTSVPPYPEIMKQADQLMYSIKQSGKNDLAVAAFRAE